MLAAAENFDAEFFRQSQSTKFEIMNDKIKTLTEEASKLPPKDQAELVEGILHRLEASDSHFDNLWPKKAKDRLKALRRREIKVGDTDVETSKHRAELQQEPNLPNVLQIVELLENRRNILYVEEHKANSAAVRTLFLLNGAAALALIAAYKSLGIGVDKLQFKAYILAVVVYLLGCALAYFAFVHLAGCLTAKKAYLPRIKSLLNSLVTNDLEEFVQWFYKGRQEDFDERETKHFEGHMRYQLHSFTCFLVATVAAAYALV